jgi:hypothetical protein
MTRIADRTRAFAVIIRVFRSRMDYRHSLSFSLRYRDSSLGADRNDLFSFADGQSTDEIASLSTMLIVEGFTVIVCL